MTAAPLRVMVVDDEPLAVERLQLLLARQEDVTVAGTANDGEGAAAENGEDGGGTGVGLRNVRERLIARFGDRAGCLHGPDPDGGYTVHLFMPVARG